MRFVGLVLLQVLVLNHINFLGYINPYLYIIFILALPVDMAHWKVIFMGFLLGLSIDFFGDTGGVHAAACLAIAYVRPKLLRASYGLSYDHRTIKFYEASFKERLVYISLIVVCHHLVLFTLTFFNLSHIILILKNTLFSSIFTIILMLITVSLTQQIKR